MLVVLGVGKEMEGQETFSWFHKLKHFYSSNKNIILILLIRHQQTIYNTRHSFWPLVQQSGRQC